MTAVVFEWNNGAVEKVQLAGSFTQWETVGKLISTSSKLSGNYFFKEKYFKIFFIKNTNERKNLTYFK